MCEADHRVQGEGRSVIGVSDFVEELVVAITSVRVYYEKHPRVLSSLQLLVKGLDELLDRLELEELELGISDGYLFIDHSPLLGATLAAGRIIQPLTELDAGGISPNSAINSTSVSSAILLAPRRTGLFDTFGASSGTATQDQIVSSSASFPISTLSSLKANALPEG